MGACLCFQAEVLHQLDATHQILQLALTRSQEHVLLACADGSIRGFVLARGVKNVDVKVTLTASQLVN